MPRPHPTLHGATIECATLFTKIECKCRARSSPTGEKLSLQPALQRRLGYILFSPPLSLSTLFCASFFVCCINCNTNRRAAKCERGTVHSTLYLCICVSHGYTDTAHTDSFVGVAECEMLLSFHVSAATEFYVRHG